MSEYTVTIQIRNDTGAEADIVLFHSGATVPDGGNAVSNFWTIPAGETAGLLTVSFDPDFINTDYWAVSAFVRSGPDAGLYVSAGDTFSNWIECQLEEEDGGTTPTFSVSTSTFDVALDSGGCTNGMTKLSPLSSSAGAAISRVFVVMLENRSFDHIFAWSGLPDIDVAGTGNSNTYVLDGVYYTANFTPGAPQSLPSDPGHEFKDVLVQLCGTSTTYIPGQPYPPTDNSGFVKSYATSTSEPPKIPPPLTAIGDVMRGFTTATALPNLYALAANNAICDHWHASMPGPTWPNRFFIHGASSSGLDDSPTNEQTAEWEAPGSAGFQYMNGSIFDRLKAQGIPHALYNDYTWDWLSAYSDDPENGSAAGAVPQAGAIANLSAVDFSSLEDFASDLQGPYPYPYTFIEPHYGDITGGTYAGGSSQHPMDDVIGGDRLLGAVYNAIVASPHWGSSLLVITYDEHGGLYDKVPPPTGVSAPDDNPTFNYSTHDFDFTTLGVRVPAVLVSPLIASGTVSHTVYDHASALKILEELWDLAPLTERDKHAESPLQCVTLSTPRTDAVALPAAPPPAKREGQPVTSPERAARLSQPLPNSGAIVGTLAVLRKTDLELSGDSPVTRAALETRWATIRTRGDVETYAREVLPKVRAERALRRPARPGT